MTHFNPDVILRFVAGIGADIADFVTATHGTTQWTLYISHCPQGVRVPVVAQ